MHLIKLLTYLLTLYVVLTYLSQLYTKVLPSIRVFFHGMDCVANSLVPRNTTDHALQLFYETSAVFTYLLSHLLTEDCVLSLSFQLTTT